MNKRTTIEVWAILDNGNVFDIEPKRNPEWNKEKLQIHYGPEYPVLSATLTLSLPAKRGRKTKKK
jgi:hypothetical protein